MAKLHIRKGDKVVVIAGKDKGKEGTVLHVMPARERVVVEGCNVVKKAARPTQQNPQGGILRMEAPIHVSNVQVVCPKCKKPARLGIDRTDGKRKRVCKKCGKAID